MGLSKEEEEERELCVREKEVMVGTERESRRLGLIEVSGRDGIGFKSSSCGSLPKKGKNV
jgi:hypothetical protein